MPRALYRPNPAHIARWFLLWFALSIGAAIASPVVHPQAMELVCSSSGTVKAVVHTEDGAQEMGAGHMDCPLCAMVGAPPVTPVVDLPVGQPQALAPRPLPPGPVVALASAPLPARGPPFFF